LIGCEGGGDEESNLLTVLTAVWRLLSLQYRYRLDPRKMRFGVTRRDSTTNTNIDYCESSRRHNDDGFAR
jgi:hypothetical protein